MAATSRPPHGDHDADAPSRSFDLGSVPFSFEYGGAKSTALLGSWPRSTRVETASDRSTTIVTWTDPASDLIVAWSYVQYADSPVTSWHVNFTNSGSAALTPISDVLAIDVTSAVSHSPDWLIRTLNGSDAAATDFEPFAVSLRPGAFRQFTTRGGRSTNGHRNPQDGGSSLGGAWPYWNVDGGDAGVIVAIGWPGQWAAEIQRPDSGAVRVIGGVATTDGFVDGEHITDHGLNAVALPAGESFDSPMGVLLSWRGGDWIDAQNTWRRWFVDHALPVNAEGRPRPLVTAQANDSFPGQLDTSADELAWLDAFGDHHATAATGGIHDHWWLDAGWYDAPDVGNVETRWMQTGTWHPDPERFPDGLRPVTDRARSLGMASIVWTEPERVMPNTWLASHHPEWLLSSGTSDAQFDGKAYLLDFGNPEALAWAVDHFDALIRDEGIDVLREDFNINPLSFWNRADAPPRAASRGFSQVQGANDWRYQRRSGADWVDIETYRQAGHLAQPEWGEPGHGSVWPTGIRPGPLSDTARTWIAPRSGSVSIAGAVAKIDPIGQRVVASIILNDEVVWGPTTIDAVARPAAHDISLSVAEGDAVRFIVERTTTSESASTEWDPAVAYPEEASGAHRQKGWAQIKYILGHLSYWRQLRERTGALWIDSCAAGGRRMDIRTMSESAVLLRSDWVHDPIGNQAHTHGVSLWIPFTGDAARLSGSRSAYEGRSAMTPSFHLKVPVVEPAADWSTLRSLAFEFAAVRDAYLGDYYPLTAHSVADDAVIAFQFHERSGQGGFVQVFRRPESTAPTFVGTLRGLEPATTYELRDYDSNETWRRTGSELADAGIRVVLPEAPFATTVSYRRA